MDNNHNIPNQIPSQSNGDVSASMSQQQQQQQQQQPQQSQKPAQQATYRVLLVDDSGNHIVKHHCPLVLPSLYLYPTHPYAKTI